MRGGEEVADYFRTHRKSRRFEDRHFCPHCHDGPMIAAVVAYEGARWLWLPGGRSGARAYHAAQSRGFASSLRAAAASFESTEDQEFHLGLAAQFEAQAGEAHVSPFAWPMPAAGGDAWTLTATCTPTRWP